MQLDGFRFVSRSSAESGVLLQVVAAHANGMLVDEVGLDVRALEARVADLERQLRASDEQLPPAIQELNNQVERFRSKLETTEMLSWLGEYFQYNNDQLIIVY